MGQDSLCRPLPGGHLGRASVSTSMEPHIAVDGESLTTKVGEMLGVLDVFQQR